MPRPKLSLWNPAVWIIASVLFFSGPSVAFAEISPCDLLETLGTPAGSAIPLDRDTRSFVLIVQSLSSENGFTPRQFKKMLAQGTLPDPINYVSAHVPTETRFSLRKALKNLKNVDWARAQEILRGVSEKIQTQNENSSEASKKTASLWSPFLIKKDFLTPELQDSSHAVLEDLRTSSGEHFGLFSFEGKGIAAVDLHTGKSLWVSNNDKVKGRFYETHDGRALFSFNDGSNFKVIDIKTGETVASVPPNIPRFFGLVPMKLTKDDMANTYPVVFERSDGSLALAVLIQNAHRAKVLILDFSGKVLAGPYKLPPFGRVIPGPGGKLYVTSWDWSSSPVNKITVREISSGEKVIFETTYPDNHATPHWGSEFMITPSGHRYVSLSSHDSIYIYDLDGKDPAKPFVLKGGNDGSAGYTGLFSNPAGKNYFIFVGTQNHGHQTVNKIDLDTFKAETLFQGGDSDWVEVRGNFINREGHPQIVVQVNLALVVIDVDHPEIQDSTDLSKFTNSLEKPLITELPDGKVDVIFNTGKKFQRVQLYGPPETRH